MNKHCKDKDCANCIIYEMCNNPIHMLCDLENWKCNYSDGCFGWFMSPAPSPCILGGDTQNKKCKKYSRIEYLYDALENLSEEELKKKLDELM